MQGLGHTSTEPWISCMYQTTAMLHWYIIDYWSAIPIFSGWLLSLVYFCKPRCLFCMYISYKLFTQHGDFVWPSTFYRICMYIAFKFHIVFLKNQQWSPSNSFFIDFFPTYNVLHWFLEDFWVHCLCLC